MGQLLLPPDTAPSTGPTKLNQDDESMDKNIGKEKREREEIAYIDSHQFKARPMPNLSCPTTAITQSTSRRASPQKSTAESRKSTVAPVPPPLTADEI